MTAKEKQEYRKQLLELSREYRVYKSEYSCENMDNPYKAIAIAVVIQTIEDYIKGHILLDDFKRYMKSDLFSLYTDIDKDWLISVSMKKRKAYIKYEMLREEYYEKTKNSRRNNRN